jgi:uncharacterized protein
MSEENSFLPKQTAIDSYGDLGFSFADMSHKGSLLSLPNKMLAWDIKSANEINLTSLAPIFEQADEIDILLIGMGADIAFFDKDIRQALRKRSIIVEAISTASAISTYNVLLNEKRAVAAALIAVERRLKR